jgi:hypothetical protein
MRTAFIFTMLAVASWAQWQAGPPLAGCLLDERGGLRRLWGVAGNFVVGELLAEGVVSAACPGGGAAIKLERELQLVDERGAVAGPWQAPPGPALFAYDAAGWPALVYFVQERILYRLHREGLEPLRPLEEETVALAWLDRDKALRAVRRAGRLELLEFVPDDPASDVLVQTLPGDGPVIALERGNLLIADGSRLLLRHADGSFRSYAMPDGVAGLRLMGDGWIEAELAGGSARLAVRIAREELAMFALPEVAP